MMTGVELRIVLCETVVTPPCAGVELSIVLVKQLRRLPAQVSYLRCWYGEYHGSGIDDEAQVLKTLRGSQMGFGFFRQKAEFVEFLQH
jgi:hypothetical protein